VTDRWTDRETDRIAMAKMHYQSVARTLLWHLVCSIKTFISISKSAQIQCKIIVFSGNYLHCFSHEPANYRSTNQAKNNIDKSTKCVAKHCVNAKIADYLQHIRFIKLFFVNQYSHRRPDISAVPYCFNSTLISISNPMHSVQKSTFNYTQKNYVKC